MIKPRAFAFLVGVAVLFLIFITTTLTAGGMPIPGEGTNGGGLSLPQDHNVSPDNGNGGNPLAAGEHLPLMIRWSNWRTEFGPALVYAREQDLDGMLRMDGPVQKMLMVTSYGEAERLMGRAAELHEAGVVIVGLNTENGLTPSNEMQTLDSPDPNVNIVARVARLATEAGFEVIWGPVRRVADTVSDEMLRTIMEAGVSGVALQEQKFIEVETAETRIRAVEQTRDRYLRLADDMGLDSFSIHVQIMHERCPNMGECVQFVGLLEAIPVSSIAIWSNGPIPVSFVEEIRGEG